MIKEEKINVIKFYIVKIQIFLNLIIKIILLVVLTINLYMD